MNKISKQIYRYTARIAFVLFFLMLSAFPLSAAAQEQINNFEVDISIQKDSSIVVTEQISYDFGGRDRHGIFRNIPTRYNTNAGDRTIGVKVQTVQRDAQAEPYEISGGYDTTEVKIGDPDKTITGQHTYTIVYEVRNALNYFEEFDELYWNVTGTEWDVPIRQASAEVMLPGNINSSQIQASCYAGSAGSDTPCGNISKSTSLVSARVQDLDAGEGLTVAVGFPKRIVAEPTALERVWWWLSSNMVLLFPPFVFVGMFYWWYRRGRDPEGRGTIITQYEPPEGMTPTMVGTLVNEKVNDRDITAGVISLAEQGFVHIKRIEGKTLMIFDTVDYELTLKRPMSEVQNEIEEDILALILGSGAEVGDTVKISELKDDRTVAENIKDLKEDLNSQMVSRGYFVSNPRQVMGLYFAGGFMVAWILAVLTSFFDNPLFIISGIISGLIIAGFGYIMPRKTKEGARTKEYLLGFKDFLTVTQKQRLEFHNAPKRSPEEFMEYLPYAVSMGVEEEWAKQFEDMYIEAPGWYSGNTTGRVATVAFADDLSDATSGISQSVTSAAAAGSSGSGGGGFSGGGMGGGGGGSW